MTAPARTAAFRALSAIDAGQTDLPSALAVSRRQLPDDRDRALTAEIVAGTLRWQRSLDHLIAHGAQRPLASIDADVLRILRLSLYQLLHLDRVPASAVVDDAVDLARLARRTSASGFVNAVLRGLLRQRQRLPIPRRPDDPLNRAEALAYLGIAHSHPEWLVTRWFDRYGFDATEAWVQFDNSTPRVTLRANTLRQTRDTVAAELARRGITTEPTRFAPDGLVVLSGNPLGEPLDGSFLVQDEASQLVSLAVGAQPGDRVLDLCAAPGGKTIAMAAAMHGRGLLVASDVRARRITLLSGTVRTNGVQCVRVLHVDATGDLPFHAGFDRVLVDAPCSSLGTIRRDPDVRWRRTENDLATFAAAQGILLQRASEVVKPGGRLVYATCSSEPDENDAVVSTFLETHPGFALVDLREAPASLEPVLDERGMLRTLPSLHALDAFFAAVMVKRLDA